VTFASSPIGETITFGTMARLLKRGIGRSLLRGREDENTEQSHQTPSGQWPVSLGCAA
jgi:hypothetical protein